MTTKRATQGHEVYQKMRPLLLHGQLQPGVRLRETDWATRLGVHRGALRQAFSLLVHEGLLRLGERGGHFVRAYEQTDLDDVLEFRASLECGAIRRLARLGAPVDVSELRATIETMTALMRQGMVLGFAEADRRFHEQLVALSGNKPMMLAYRHAPVVITAQFETFDTSRQEAILQTTINDHLEICDRLEAGEFTAAIDLLDAHLFTAHSSSVLAV